MQAEYSLVFKRAFVASILTLLVLPFSALAHEAWIEPFEYHLKKSPVVRGHLRVGQLFRGAAQLYNTDKFVRFESDDGTSFTKVKGRLGDLPAIKHKLKTPGLNALIYRSTGSVIDYPNWEKFRKFTEQEGVAWAQQAHRDRGLPEQGFSEIFIRYSKSLVSWKHAEGSDRPSGMPFEIVALSNPYLDNAGSLKVQVLWQGEPYRGGQLAVFRKQPQSETERNNVMLDDEGIVTIPIESGHSYLLNSVLMEPREGGKKAPVWTSHWASLTMEIP